MRMRAWCFLVLCAACSGGGGTSADAGADGTVDASTDSACSMLTTDANFTCDVSTIAPADRSCGDWVGQATMSGGGLSCPATTGWSGGVGGAQCEYQWMSPGPPDLCRLPTSDNGFMPFAWLHPNCGSGCPQGDAGAPSPCTTSNDCPATQYCELNGVCTGSGTCFPISGGVGPAGPVCGCDNKTYSGVEAAHQARVSIAYLGACE